MADLMTLINQMQADGTFDRITRNPFAQFGTGARQYLGASLLPEVGQDSNDYTEENINFRTVIAQAGDRYSPAPLVGGVNQFNQFRVKLGSTSIARQLTGREYDAVNRALGRGNDIEAAARAIRFFDEGIVGGLVEEVERQRWQAIVSAAVTRTGQNGYSETVNYPNPVGHRVAAGGDWDTDTYDPFDDILAMNDLLNSKGYTLSRIITSSKVVGKMGKNDKVRTRTGSLQVSASGNIEVLAGFATRNAVNGYLTSAGLPPIETYDLTYRNEANQLLRFLPDNVMVFVSQTGQNETIIYNEATKVVADVLGYSALGVPVGRSEGGIRALDYELKTNKPPRIEAEGWQESLPVITEPEAIAVITGID